MTTRPTHYQLAAAIQAARLIDAAGNTNGDARASYRTIATEKAFPPSSLRAGEELLLAAGLLRLEQGRLLPTSGLVNLVAIADEEAATAALKRVIAERTRTADHTKTGNAGEEHVLAEVRAELEMLHRPDLAEKCEQVSLVSDYFGYDVTAPMITGSATRLLEVKTQTVDRPTPSARFYLSRNEYDVGRNHPTEWALVACSRGVSGGETQILGWCRAATLSPYLPADQGGRWTEALVQIPISLLAEGFPPAI